MPVINVRLKSVSGNRYENVPLKDNIEIKSNFKIDSVKKIEEGNEELLRVDFSFDVAYKPNVGDLELAGFLWYKPTDMKKAAKETKQGITLEPDVIKDVSQVILRESLLESTAVARRLRLPVPIKLPEITAKFQSTEFKTSS